MINNAKRTIEVLEELVMPEIFCRIANGDVPNDLRAFCQQPKVFFELVDSLVERFDQSRFWVPLWEVNSAQIKALNFNSGCYVKYYYGDEGFSILASNYQQFITVFFLELIDAGEWDLLNDLEGAFEYDYLKELMEFVDSCPDENYLKGCSEFVRSIK